MAALKSQYPFFFFFFTFSFLCFFSLIIVSSSALNVSYDGRAFLLDGKRRVLVSGSIHYPRSTPEMWPELIRKSREGGLDAVETYVFWNVHEPVRRQYNFDGNLDLIRFIKTIQYEGLYSILRIGPYVCAEWNYGGLPVWLHNMRDIELRTDNKVFMHEMQNFTTMIVDMLKQEKLFASQGGPIILAQIENEYGNVMDSYGEHGKAYINWCAKMASSLDIGVPWIMCQQKNPPKPMIETCNGWYCDQYYPSDQNQPKIWTENWTGWFQSWGDAHPHRTAEDVAFAVARFYQLGGTLQNYYMYHGGTNFGRTAGGPYITTTYDYDAPLDEYGGLNQPKYGHLKQLHDVLHSIEDTLTHGNVSHFDAPPTDVKVTMYTTEETSTCFFSNENTTSGFTVNFQGVDFFIPPWSVTISADCKTETFNTAKVNTQTNVMVKKSEEESESKLVWSWRPENIDKAIVAGKAHISANTLMDQKRVASDASDYLWYINRFNVKEDDPILITKNLSIHINSTGQVLHLYLNGQHLGSAWGKYDIVQKDLFFHNITLKPGNNLISLLSATVGFENYGPFYDLKTNGITPGPVELIGYNGDEEIIKDLSGERWNYRVGLEGFDDSEYFKLDSTFMWSKIALPTHTMMTWYKTTFKAPLGTEPVVLDLKGMGKGMAWVNGFSIGRYWPSYKAKDDGCEDGPCDYRGTYDNNKCLSKCGEPTQRWYHVPRSILEDGENTLILFEEFGGDPRNVKFETVSVGTVCAKGYEGNVVELSCGHRQIKEIKKAHFGNPNAVCGSVVDKGTCGSENDIVSLVEQECVGKESCMIEVSEEKLGRTNCGKMEKRIAVEALCG